ncbi:MAG: hypothetical protein LBT06_10905 [Hungatella sp.]|jgi:hypothetical protein|nr:hypothetical protein [Hungatella sp.]
MEYAEHKLVCKIRFLEDKLLMSKDIYEQERIQKDLMQLRKELQKLKYKNQS